MDRPTPALRDVHSPFDRLSERQRQCLELVGEGLTSKEIARRLNLSPSTVDNHVRVAVERLAVPNRALAARMLLGGSDPVASALKDHAVQPIAGGHGGDFANPDHSLIHIPPFGGRPNLLSQRRRFFHVIQIALLGTMALAALTITIAGIVQLLAR